MVELVEESVIFSLRNNPFTHSFESVIEGGEGVAFSFIMIPVESGSIQIVLEVDELFVGWNLF